MALCDKHKNIRAFGVKTYSHQTRGRFNIEATGSVKPRGGANTLAFIRPGKRLVKCEVENCNNPVSI